MEGESRDEVNEILIGKGLGGALQYLRARGGLKETVDWGGRNMDKKKSKLVGIVDESNNVVGQRDILLDRVDEFGRTMTPKEAFRQFSHKFHGKGPGKKQQAKRQKQFQEELKQKQRNAGDTPFMSMDKICDLQAKLQSPYLVLSGSNIKPRQTSDPRSGFATVKKEPIGSLTPMLGDNKPGKTSDPRSELATAKKEFEPIGSLTPMLGNNKHGQTSDSKSGFATAKKEPIGSLTPMLGDNKPGQTSDLRSGLATAKKESIGSLTPMLGYNKTHFQGMKWLKSESGSMRPPPNKKPKPIIQ